ncbi:GrpE protein [Penicillium capsulatum]|uniref:GrpE protein homolog n=1 Tax=Penicillium capsulatum TaxID=69766 RepID=A0A9W9ID96_9EURO|nr:GrpE protein [Penicillium capsulatum]KAJ6134929.1 GrpE protein [Penicillium capsulatum]
MFQRTIFRQAQAVRSALAAAPSTSSTSLALRRTSQFQARLPAAVRPFAPQPMSRFYSTENNGEKKEASQEAEAEAENAEDPVAKELEEKKKEIVDLKVSYNTSLVSSELLKDILTHRFLQDKYLRSVAEFRNLQERTKRDMDSARNFAIQRFAKDLLESIDNFDRALLAVPKEKLSAPESEANKDLLDLVAGLDMTQNILMSTLQKHGLERFDPSEKVEGKAQKFDPNLHEATFMSKAEGMDDGDVMYTQSKGFRLNGRVLRAAKVGVVKNE